MAFVTSKWFSSQLNAMARSEYLEWETDVALFFMDFHLDQLFNSMYANDPAGIEYHMEQLELVRQQLSEMEYWRHEAK